MSPNRRKSKRNRTQAQVVPIPSGPPSTEVAPEALISHGLEFIDDGVEQLLRNDTDRSTMFAVVHLAVGAELLLKSRLLAEHWSLIFDKGSEPNRQKYLIGDFQSVSSEVCLRRLQDVAGVRLRQPLVNSLAELRSTRNRIVHFTPTEQKDALRVVALRALSELVDFIHEECQPTHDVSARLITISDKLLLLRDYVTKRRKSIRAEVAALGDDVYWCPRCSELALRSPSVTCIFCRAEFAAIQDVMDYHVLRVAGENAKHNVDWGRCPSCFQPFVVRLQEGRDSLRCMSCKHSFVVSGVRTCIKCDEWHCGSDAICNECREHNLGSAEAPNEQRCDA